MTSRLIRGGIAAAFVASLLATSACTEVQGTGKKVVSDGIDHQKGITTPVVTSALATSIKAQTDNVSAKALLDAGYVPTYTYTPKDPQADRSYVVFRVCDELTPEDCKLKINPTSGKPDIGLPLKEPIVGDKATFDLGFRVSYTALGAHGGIVCNATAKSGQPLPVINDKVMGGLVETGKLVSETFTKTVAGAEHLVAIADGEMLCNKA